MHPPKNMHKEMEIRFFNTEGGKKIAELHSSSFVISETQDILDIFGSLYGSECQGIIIHEHNLNSRFFDLKTGLAGEILQKFSNYRMRLAIVGDFSKFNSKSFKDFVFESNNSNLVFFTGSFDAAIKRLG